MSFGAGLTQSKLAPSAIGHPDTSVREFTNWSGVPFQSDTVLGKYEFLNTSVWAQ